MAWLGDVEDCCAQIELEGSLGNVDSWVLLSHEVDVAHRQILAHDVPPVVALGVVPDDC